MAVPVWNANEHTNAITMVEWGWVTRDAHTNSHNTIMA